MLTLVTLQHWDIAEIRDGFNPGGETITHYPCCANQPSGRPGDRRLRLLSQPAGHILDDLLAQTNDFDTGICIFYDIADLSLVHIKLLRRCSFRQDKALS